MGKVARKLSSPNTVLVVIFGQDGISRAVLLPHQDLGDIKYKILYDFGTVEFPSGYQALTWSTNGSRLAIPVSSYRHIDVFIYVVNNMNIPWLSPFELVKGRSDFSKSVLAVAVNKGTPETLEEVRTGLDLDKSSQKPVYEMFPIASTTGEGLDKLEDWLSQEISKKFPPQWFLGSDDHDQHHIKKRDTKSFHKRILRSFKGVFTKI